MPGAIGFMKAGAEVGDWHGDAGINRLLWAAEDSGGRDWK